MRAFREYLQDGIVKRQSPDPSRSHALASEAHESYILLSLFLKRVKLTDQSANLVIKNAYDIIMQLVRSEMLSQGYNATGHGAHEAEVSFLCHLGFSEQDVDFADRLRYYRNGILYYGKTFDADYALKVLQFLAAVKTILETDHHHN